MCGICDEHIAVIDGSPDGKRFDGESMEQFGERVIAIAKQRNPGRKVNFIDMGKWNNIKDYLEQRY